MEAFGQLVLAGAFAGWYWTFKKPDNLPANGLLASFYRTVRYHLGEMKLVHIKFVKSCKSLLQEPLLSVL